MTTKNYGEILTSKLRLYSQVRMMRPMNTFNDCSDLDDPWCYVCNRPTDHRAEHDDLVEQGKARYDDDFGNVYYNPRGLVLV